MNKNIFLKTARNIAFLTILPGAAVAAPVVKGSVISWANDGWYQVQNAHNLATSCEGGTSCIVPEGTYTVINHSTGERFENVVVGNNPAPVVSSTSSIMVEGTTISWPNDGWYQVQSIDNFSNVCEGGTSCTVTAGRYQVINLTTGHRFDPITITESSDISTDYNSYGDTTPELTADNMNAVILQAFEVFTGQAYDRRLREFPYMNSGLAPNCQTGSAVHNPHYIRGQETDSFEFSVSNQFYNCDFFGDNLSGRVSTQYDEANDQSLSHTFSNDFGVNIKDIARMELEGGLRIDCCDGVMAVYTNDFDYFFSYSGGELTVESAQTYVKHSADKTLRMGGSFTMRPPVLNGLEVTVYTESEFVNNDLSYSGGARTLSFSQGRMIIVADNSEIQFEIDNEDVSQANVTLTTSAGAESSAQSMSTWSSALSIKLPKNKFLIHDGGTGSSTPAITLDNYSQLVALAFDVYNGQRYGNELIGLPYYSDEYYMNDRNSVWTDRFYEGLGPVINESCARSGTANFTPYQYGYSSTTLGFDYDFNACDDGTTRYEGDFSRRINYALDLNSTGFSSTSTNNNIEFEGGINYRFNGGRSGSPSRSYGLKNVSYNRTSSRGAVSLEANLSRYEAPGYDLRSVAGDFTLTAPETGNQRIQVAALTTLANGVRRDENPNGAFDYFQTGTLQISGPSGNKVILRVDNGSDSSVDIDLYEDGILYEFSQPWSRWRDSVEFRTDLTLNR